MKARLNCSTKPMAHMCSYTSKNNLDLDEKKRRRTFEGNRSINDKYFSLWVSAWLYSDFLYSLGI